MSILKKLNLSKKTSVPNVAKGRFVVIDGIDGSGKSTQLQLLKDELLASGYEVEDLHFPQHGQYSATMVDAYLAGKFGDLNPYAASVFYALDRFEAREKISSWLNAGKIVLCDRYVTANAGHQGGKINDEIERLKFFKWLDNLEFGIFGLPKPDLNIILNVPAVAALKLLNFRPKTLDHEDVLHEKNIDHLKQSSLVYEQIAKLFSATKLIVCVENNQLLSPQEIHNKVWEMVRRIALKDFKPKK